MSTRLTSPYPKLLERALLVLLVLAAALVVGGRILSPALRVWTHATEEISR